MTTNEEGLSPQTILNEALEDTDINIAPIMNLFVILIPFLLLSASFVNFNMIETPAPTGASTTDSSAPPVTLTLSMTPTQWQLESQPARGSMKKVSVKAGDETALIQRLMEIKAQFPQHRTVFLKTEQGVQYGAIIRIMDVLRTHEDKEMFPEVVFADVY